MISIQLNKDEIETIISALDFQDYEFGTYDLSDGEESASLKLKSKLEKFLNNKLD